jgi:hypothetical protein
MGDGQIELNWEKKVEKLDVRKSVELPVPHLKPQAVDRAWGQIAMVKSETIDVQPTEEPASLRPIDPQHDLMAPVASAARAFEFHDDWTLRITATRYELEEVKRTSIERAVVRMVVTPADSISVQALYRMRSARQRLEVVLPEGAAFGAEPLRINGRPVTLQTGQHKGYDVPLVGADPDTPFVMELRYTLAGDGRQLDLPAFPQEPAVVKAYLCVYLPDTRTLLGVRGPWSEEFRWQCGPSLRWQPSPRVTPDELVAWVREGAASGAAAEDFPTAGRLFVYSTLNPAAPPGGSLETTTVEDRSLSGLVFAVTVLLGVLLLPARLPLRALAVGAAIIALVLAGVFLPTFSLQVLNGVLASAIFVVAVMWSAGAIARGRRQPPPTRETAGGPPPNVEPIAPPPSPEQQAAPAAEQGGPTHA